MTNHTADEFRTARFAAHPDGLLAMRDLDLEYHPWTVGERDRHCAHSDEDLAAGGWAPVREIDGYSRVTERTLEVAQSNAEKKRQKLLDHIASLEAVIRRRNDQIERQEDQIEKVMAARDEAVPLSLDTLRTAYEQAEQADECRTGDVLIWADGGGGYGIYPAAGAGSLASACAVFGAARILSRAPQREPWQDLADLIGWYDGDTDNPAELAQFLHEHEVTTPSDHDAGRVTGGDDQ